MAGKFVGFELRDPSTAVAPEWEIPSYGCAIFLIYGDCHLAFRTCGAWGGGGKETLEGPGREGPGGPFTRAERASEIDSYSVQVARPLVRRAMILRFSSLKINSNTTNYEIASSRGLPEFGCGEDGEGWLE